MDSNNKFKDWFFRYNHVLKKRFTPKQKERFIQSLIADISEIRQDIFVTEIQYDKKEKTNSKNIYVGDVRKANIIITSHFDTPANYLGPYRFFNLKARRNQTLSLNIILSLLLFLIGILFTFFITIPVINNNSSFNVYTVFIVIAYLLFFYLLRKAANGFARRENLVINTSTVLLMLELISLIKTKNIAFAFVDNGSQNNIGLEALRKSAKENSEIYYLDSIGSNQPLYYLGNDGLVPKDKIKKLDLNVFEDNRLTYILSAEIIDGNPVLTKESQKLDKINQDNLDIIRNMFKAIRRIN